jgi:hypothetical protein
MTPTEIRAKHWMLRARLEDPGNVDDAEKRREIELLQAEMLAEMAAQLAEANAVLARIGLINFEELALRLGEFFRKEEE